MNNLYFIIVSMFFLGMVTTDYITKTKCDNNGKVYLLFYGEYNCKKVINNEY